MGSKRGYEAGLVMALLVVLCTTVITTIRQQSLSWDEGDHIFSGYEILKAKDYGLNPEHPPMVKSLAAIPLIGLPLKVPALQGRFFKTEAYMDGRELLFRNGPAYSADTLIFRARLAVAFFAPLLALLVFFAAREMFDRGVGLFAMALFVFEPNLIAHGAYVATDMALSCWMFAAIYCFYRYVKVPSLSRLLILGVAAGLALAAKHSAILLLPMMLVLAAGEVFFARREATPSSSARQRILRLVGAFAIAVAVALVVLWASYGFRYAARPGGLQLDPSLANYVLPLHPLEAKGILLLGRLHILPESWLYGLADVRSMANGMPSYFFGKVYAHGVWFYFPVLFTIKSTLGFLALLGLAIYAIATGELKYRREIWFMAVPPVVYLVTAMGSHLNIGARHILPLWVFGCVLAAAGAWSLLERDRRWVYAIAVLLSAHIASSLLAYPNYIAYANEAWGGPTHTYRYLTDSNTDWGQQLKATKAYVDQHHIQQCWIAYFVAPFVLPADYGIPCKLLPTPDTWFNDVQIPVPPIIHGPVFISAGDLNSFELGASEFNLYESFRSIKPTAYIQDGIFVFQGDFAAGPAAALSHVQQSIVLLKAGQAEAALAEAQTAIGLNPGGYREDVALGDALTATGHRAEADQYYARALVIARNMVGGASEKYVPEIEKKLAH